MSGTITHEWNGTVLTVTSDSGTTSCDLKGEKGDTGIRGAQGVAGEQYKPQYGIDYFTDSEKEEFIGEVENHIDTNKDALFMDEVKSYAAPSGYGLGNYGATVNSPNDAVMSGFYRAPAPTEIASSGYMFGVVFANSANWVTQIWQHMGSLIRRNLSSGVWEDYEYINPPMKPDKEYRTTERHNGKPVYKKTISYTFTESIAPNTYVDVTIPTGITNFNEIVRGNAVVNKNSLLPYWGVGRGTIGLIKCNGTNATIRYCNQNVISGETVVISLAYTKTTD